MTDGDSPSGPFVAVIDYGIGNLRSAEKALQHVGADARLTDDPDLIARADGVVLPGVGAFGRCMEELRSRSLDGAALDAIASGRPFLGICVGMQMLYKGSEESPGVDGLAVLDGVVRRLPEGVKHPQMQWNVVDVERESHLFDGLDVPAWMYFVHSFAPDDHANTVATCQFGGRICAAVERDNVWATQFHPEKSSTNGLRLLGNFVTAAAA